jgi:5-formyltetrahydrofolate cyclo-ligase
LKQKEEIRKKYLKIREQLSDDFVMKASEAIEKKILQSPEYQHAKIVHSFVSIIDNNEVLTHGLIQKSIQNGKTIVVPKMNNDGELKHIRLDSFNDLIPNIWNVPEPDYGEEIAESDLDLILVPMVAGDRFKNRIGYGKGYYDRFLQKCRCTKIGLLFSVQLNPDKLPVESFDVPLDILFTENERIE